VGFIDTLPSTRNIPKKSSQPSLFEVGSFPGAAAMKSFDRHPFTTPNNSSSGSFLIQEMHPQMSPSHHRYHHYEPPPPQAPSFLNEQILLSAAALAASHSYPPPSSYLSSIAASNLLSSINAHFHTITPPSTNYFDEKKDFQDPQLLPTDVKNLIESSLTAIGLDNVDDNDFDKAATNAQNTTDVLIDDEMDSFERSTTPATNNTSPTHLLTSTTKQITRPMNIPNSFSNDYFSHSPSAKSPFDAPNQLFDEPLESPIDTLFPEPSTSSGTSSRPGELYKMAGFSQDLPTSPQSIFQRLNTASTNSSTSSSSEMEIMRNRVLQMQALAMTEKESSDHWRREAEENHRLAIQLEQEKTRALQQRDDALHQIEQMRQLLVHNVRLLPSDQDLMQLPLDDVQSLQLQLQQELSKLSLIEQAKSNNNNNQQTPSVDTIPVTPTATTRHNKHHHGKHVLIPSTSKQ
jgi:hypothetical protein